MQNTINVHCYGARWEDCAPMFTVKDSDEEDNTIVVAVAVRDDEYRLTPLFTIL